MLGIDRKTFDVNVRDPDRRHGRPKVVDEFLHRLAASDSDGAEVAGLPHRFDRLRAETIATRPLTCPTAVA